MFSGIIEISNTVKLYSLRFNSVGGIILAIHIISEERYKNNTWFNRIVNGIVLRSKQLREKIDFAVPENTENDARFIVVGTTSSWIYDTVNELNKIQGSAVVLISNRPYALSVSNVCTDFYTAVRNVISYLHGCGRKKTAMYGVNPSSVSDGIKLSGFPDKDNVYYNNGDLGECFESFTHDIKNYDSVICTNDYAAMSLVGNLKKYYSEELKRLFIVSFANTHSAEMSNPSVTSVALDYEGYGRAAVDLFGILKKNGSLQSVTVYVKSRIIARDTTDNISPLNSECVSDTSDGTEIDFYKDEEVRKLVKRELVFEQCDRNDLTALKMLSEGKSYEETAESVFMTVNGLKYRLDKICRTCGFSDRRELISSMKE